MEEEPQFDIWPPYEAFYIESMLFSTKAAIAAAETANYFLDRVEEWYGQPEKHEPNADLILDNIQVLVSCGAALSRYFWPACKKSPHKQRARRLREALGVQEPSPLRNRDLRNMIEHFDEKLDEFLQGGAVGHFVQAYIGNQPEDPEVPTHLFRAYYTEPAIFEVLGHRFEIKPIFQEIQRLHILLDNCSKNGSVLPRD
jgi:hypothetical protein